MFFSPPQKNFQRKGMETGEFYFFTVKLSADNFHWIFVLEKKIQRAWYQHKILGFL